MVGSVQHTPPHAHSHTYTQQVPQHSEPLHPQILPVQQHQGYEAPNGGPPDLSGGIATTQDYDHSYDTYDTDIAASQAEGNQAPMYYGAGQDPTTLAQAYGPRSNQPYGNSVNQIVTHARLYDTSRATDPTAGRGQVLMNSAPAT